MKTLEILRSWRTQISVMEKASLEEVEAASRALAEFERELGPGQTAHALDCAIEREATRVTQTPRRRRGAAKKAIQGEE